MADWPPSRSEVRARALRLWRGFPDFCIGVAVLAVVSVALVIGCFA